MERHQVSALKFRPATFGSIVGQTALTTTLKHAIEQDKLAHAYLFCGPRGVGKTTSARIFAKTINCSNRDANGEPCNTCESCVSFNEQRSYNIIEMDAASNNSVDDMRALIEKVRVAPLIGRYRVYIIDEVHMLSTAAFNAFLKTLEEPPAHAIFILATTDKHKVLPTIISRCQVFDFSRISVQDIAGQLRYVAQSEGIEVEEEALQTIAVHADGGMRDALSIFDQIAGFGRGKVTYQGVLDNLNLLDEAEYFEMMAHVLMGNHPKLLLLVNRIVGRGFEPARIASGFAAFLRNLLLAQDPQTISLIQTAESIRERYRKAGAACSPALVWKCLKLASSYESEYKYCASQRLALEVTLLKMAELSNRSTLVDASAPVAPSAPTATPPVASPTSTPITDTTSQTVGVLSVKLPTPKETPAPSQSNMSKIQSRLSISLLPQQSQEQQEAAKQLRSNPFTADDLLNGWYSFAASLTTQLLLKQTMRDCKPTLTPDGTIEIEVTSPQHQMQLQSVEGELMTHLADHLQNDTIKMRILLIKSNSQKKRIPLRPDEKMEYFINKNPWFAKLTQALQLQPTI